MNSTGSAPFIHTERNTPYIQLMADIALLPCCVAAVFNYGLTAAFNIVIAALVAFAIDAVIERRIRKREYYYDLSSFFYGMCFALMLPPATPVFITVIGISFGIIAGKQLFGGVGAYFVNPSVVGRLAVELMFPSCLQGFAEPGDNWLSLAPLISVTDPGIDISAVPSDFYFLEVIFGRFATYAGTGGILFIFAGFIYLCLKKAVRFYCAAGFTSVAVTGMLIIDFPLGFRYFLIHLISSGILFAAVFLLSASTTVPSNSRGGILAGVAAGITCLVLIPMGSPIALICVPVLVANLTTVSFEYFTTLRKGYGELS